MIYLPILPYRILFHLRELSNLFLKALNAIQLSLAFLFDFYGSQQVLPGIEQVG